MSFAIRATTLDDLPEITEIYREHVITGLASFEYDPPDLFEMTARFHKIQQSDCPYLVASLDNQIVGYAYAGLFHARFAYRGTVEDSIYLSPAAQGRGIGTALLKKLIDECSARGFRQMIAIITKLDPAISVRLHEKAGFFEAGTLKAVGFKQGQWLDVIYMQRSLGSGAETPL